MKERITITIDNKLLNWLDSKVKDRIFANRSHGFEFLIKQKGGACYAMPTTLSRTSGDSAWTYAGSQDGYQISCSNHKRLREGTTLDAPESSPTTAGTAAGDKADETLNKAETNIDRVERAKSVADWLKNL